MKWRLARLAGGIALLVSAGCDTFRACTLIGCVNGLMIQFAAPPTSAYRVEVSSGNGTVNVFECPTAQCGGARFEDYFPQTATVTVITAAGTTTTTIAPEYTESYPNGHACGPACRRANVTVSPPA
jgi:hypothetical protein